MNYFGHMADDLTAMEMAIDLYGDIPNAKALKAALQRAFVEACKASRAQRLAREALAAQLPQEPSAAAEKIANPVRRAQEQLRRAVSS
ncbi:MAG: hypothetical protein ABWZ40_05275 [Caulobacterales bacterium]